VAHALLFLWSFKIYTFLPPATPNLSNNIDGPLTYSQLECNLPPIVGASISLFHRSSVPTTSRPTTSSSANNFTNANSSVNATRSSSSVPNSTNSQTLQDILDVLVVTGVVQKRGDGQQYTMLSGKPRADVVTPSDIFYILQHAMAEEERTLDRIQTLKRYLALASTAGNSSNSNTKIIPSSAREVFKSILWQYPEVAQDPVYMTGLRNLHVDVAALERERLKSRNTMVNKHYEHEQSHNINVSGDRATCMIPPYSNINTIADGNVSPSSLLSHNKMLVTETQIIVGATKQEPKKTLKTESTTKKATPTGGCVTKKQPGEVKAN